MGAGRIIKFQYEDSKRSLSKFWAVLLVVDILLYVLNKSNVLGGSLGMSQYSGGVSSLSIMGANLMAIFIYLIVYNYENFYKNFPLALSFSITRQDFFKSILVKNLCISLTLGMIQGLLLTIDAPLVRSIGRVPIVEFVLFNTELDKAIYIIFAISIVFLTFLSLWSVVAALNYRFGYIIWIIFVAIQFLLERLNLAHIYNNIFQYIFNLFFNRIDLGSFLQLFLIILISHGLTYIITINTDIQYKSA